MECSVLPCPMHVMDGDVEVVVLMHEEVAKKKSFRNELSARLSIRLPMMSFLRQ